MKKLLFTLAALMMAGSLCAEEYLYIEDAELTADQLGTEVQFNVTAHLDAMINAFTLDFGSFDADGEFVANELPAGLTITSYNVKVSTAKITYLYWDGDEGELVEDTCTPSIGVAQNNTRFIGMTSAMDTEWAEIDGVPTNCGAIKWKPGEFVMLRVKFTVPADFTGAAIAMRTQPACGTDPRGNTAEPGQVNVKTFNLTVEGGTPPPPEPTPKPVITVTPDEDAMGVTVLATGMGEVILKADGVVVENPYHVARVVGEEVHVHFTATAQGENMLISEEEVYDLYLDALPDNPKDLQGDIVVNGPDEDGYVTITYTGDEDVTITVNGEPYTGAIQLEEGENTLEIVVSADGYNDKTVTETVTYTPTPGPGPGDDPHMEGHWLVVIDMFNVEHWFKLQKGSNNDYVTSVSLEYYTYGPYDPDPENAAQVPFYFMVDGVQYGAEDALTEATLGLAMENPLVGSEECYTVPVGYAYTLGIAVIEGEKYVYAAQGPQTDVDEVNAAKTVAGVRYFNMAGQEMQEANGMTIVVTTYTDGTTSAVKVMK